jgi:hypothetical protein
MIRKSLLALVALATLAGGAAVANADHYHGGRGHGRGHGYHGGGYYGPPRSAYYGGGYGYRPYYPRTVVRSYYAPAYPSYGYGYGGYGGYGYSSPRPYYGTSSGISFSIGF